MTENYRPRVRYVIGPDGSPLTVADLPPRDTKRWVIRRKAEVVAAVRGGLISLEEACERPASRNIAAAKDRPVTQARHARACRGHPQLAVSLSIMGWKADLGRSL